ncbi:ribosomal protein S8 [Desulfovibrio sp. X2]|uniref:30S ribosomal protein S8 n=1 Tax=Desulfovibrio sp. X2 TaxID=941449 RepID=UPI0003586D74|nr:30S ribosomal protein S8 [Desulfovibrio sp. X2]EPR42634.1 ribosomal protein S8 [Desulfovibrio sp. X2]
MAVCDPVADMLARLRNAHQGLHAHVNVPVSKMKADLARILKEEGFIADYEVGERDMVITLKYAGGKPVINGAKKISTPGRRVYVGVGDIPRVRNGLGICVLSTSRGILEGNRAATEKVGGELLCEIW